MMRLQTLVAVLIAVGAGTLAGSWITAKTGRTIPILVAAPVSASAAQVSFDDGFAPVVKRAVAAIVNVSTSKVVRTPGQNLSPLFSDPLFRKFFGNSMPQSTAPSTQREQSLGSGVIVSPDGYILTNNHVIDGATDVRVLLSDNRAFQAKVVGKDPKTDIAVLKVSASGLPVLAFGDSSKMQAGNFVLAIGSPFGLNQTVTLGIVSATGRGGLGIEDYEDFIQTDAAINPGNSGGALMNARGELIGINTAILTGSGGGGSEGVGFAIPGNMARVVMEDILRNGKVTRAWLGVATQPVTQDIAKSFGSKDNYGALVSEVEKDSPAAASGLKVGDIVLDVDGQRIEDSRALQLKISMMPPGTAVKLTIFRNGATQEIPVKLAEMPANVGSSGPAAGSPGEPRQSQPGTSEMRGITVTDLTPDVAAQLKLPSGTKGVVVTNVDQASSAASAGIQQGDVIQEVNRQAVTGISGFDRAMRGAGDQAVLLLVDRNGITSFIVVQPN
jgi:serine protease Do